MMVEALLSNFAALPDVNAWVMPRQDTRPLDAHFKAQIQHADAVWVIAPEFDGILETFCRYVEASGKKLLTSPSSAVSVTANKLMTFEQLCRAHIQTVPTALFDENHDYDTTQAWIIKPIDGAGAENTFLLTSINDWQQRPQLNKAFIIQPYIEGEKISLSCLFHEGSAELLCVNLQLFEQKETCFALQTIRVNDRPDHTGDYQRLASQIACAFPDLWGYVGIDLIQTPSACFVLEINPRLTSSFTQIEPQLGINVASKVMALWYD